MSAGGNPTSYNNQIELQYPINGLNPILPAYPYEDHCERLFPTFNATGTYSLGSTIVNDVWSVGGNATEDLTWSVGVSQTFNTTANATTTATYGWLGAPPGINLAAYNLPYSGCAFFMGGLQNNTVQRGQTDNGDCSATFSSACAQALINQTQELALQIVNADTTESGSSTTPLLPQVCLQIEQGLSAKGAVPSACSQFVGKNMTWSEGQLSEINMQFVYTEITGPNSTISETCSANTTAHNISYPKAPGSTLSLMGVTEVSLFPSNAGNNYTLWNEYNDIFYQNGTTWVYPIITVLFPPANTSKLGYSAAANRTLTAEAYMTCARPVNITEGSKVPFSLPAPTPLPKLPLSKGAKAGIAIGVILCVLLIGALLGLFLWQRRKKRAAKAAAMEEEKRIEDEKRAREEEENKKELASPMLDSENVPRYEMSGDGRKPEIGGEERHEMEGSPVGELSGNTLDHELEGTKSGQSLTLEEW